MITTSLPIETPEGISFVFEPAGIVERGFAYLIDLLIRISIVLVLGLALLVALGPARVAGAGLWLIIVFVVEWGYYVLFETLWDGRSPGKRVFDLRVLKTEGHPVGLYESALRNLVRAADIVPFTYGVGILSILSTRRLQRLGDLAAGTIVVVEQRAWLASRGRSAAPAPVGGADAQRPSAPEGDAGLRALSLTNRERRLLEEFATRARLLHPERREQLAAILAASYRRRLGDPAELAASKDSEVLLRLHVVASAAPKEQPAPPRGAP